MHLRLGICGLNHDPFTTFLAYIIQERCKQAFSQALSLMAPLNPIAIKDGYVCFQLKGKQRAFGRCEVQVPNHLPVRQLQMVPFYKLP